MAVLDGLAKHASELLGALRRVAEHSEGALAYASLALLRSARLVTDYALLSLQATSVILAVGLACVVAVAHITLLRFRPRPSVFISYFHENLRTARVAAVALQKSGLRIELVPFNDDPEHDGLLDRIRQQIASSNIMICLPGPATSFVDNEVAMAFALRKPMIFLLDSSGGIHLPNTAKKGYPVFDGAELERRNYVPLATLASYLCADRRSTFALYAAAMEHLLATATLVLLSFLVLIMCAYGLSAAGADPTLVSVALASVGVTVLLLPYALFTTQRFALRRRLRSVVANVRFTEASLPASLGLRFSRRSVIDALYRGSLVAHHETEQLSGQSPGRNAEPVAASRAEILARAIYAGPCELCGATAAIDLHSSYRVHSFLLTWYHEVQQISCRKCARRAQLRAVGWCLLLGWWGPYGLIFTPLQLARNIFALALPPSDERPSDRLIAQLEGELAAAAELSSNSGAELEGGSYRAFCPSCERELFGPVERCSHCLADFGPGSPWKLRRQP